MTTTSNAMYTRSTSGSGLVCRAAARAVDFILVAGVGVAVGAVTGFGIGWFAFEFVLVAGYFVGLDAAAGATLGKALLGLRIVATDGTDRRPTVLEAARQEAFVVLGTVPFVGPVLATVGWSAIAWSIHRNPLDEGVHDRFARTEVVAAR